MLSVVIPGAGQGRRMNSKQNKVLLPLGDKPILVHTISWFQQWARVAEIVVVVGENEVKDISQLVVEFGLSKVKQVVVGGNNRQESVYRGLQAISTSCEYVFIHDAARPLIDIELLERTYQAVLEHQAVGVGVRVKDTIKVVEDGVIVSTPPRSSLWSVQTPQAFAYSVIMDAHQKAAATNLLATDDCSLVEDAGVPTYLVEGSYENIKLTTPEDLIMGKALLGVTEINTPRVGFGYDVHQLVDGRPLILCGVKIPAPLGLAGHSDADVAVHALMDALLGAAALGDIGQHFPDTDQAYLGISSLVLLKQVFNLITVRGITIAHVDITIAAQRPRLASYIPQMQAEIAATLQLQNTNVNVKATTTEKLGFIGREEGIAAYAVATLLEACHRHSS